MPNNSIFNHLKNILLLPVNVTIVIPFILYKYVDLSQILDNSVWLIPLGSIFILAGIYLLGRTIYLFKTKGRGTLAPWNPTRKLVIEGPYRYVRNPMIAGVLCVLFGESIMLNSVILLIWTMLFFIINTLYFQFVEEPKLERKFGESYLNYKDEVARWIPKLKPYKN